MFSVVQNALIFIALWGLGSKFISFGAGAALYSAAMILTACLAAIGTHVVYYAIADALEKKEFDSFSKRITTNWKKVQRGVPVITGLILAVSFQTATPLYVVAAAAIVAELVGKLMWGGFAKNKLNPAAVGFILIGIIFGYYITMPPLYDAASAATPLSIVAQNGWHFTADRQASFAAYFGSLGSLLVGSFSGPLAEISRLASLIALVYMAKKKALDWLVPAFMIGTVFFITFFVGLYHGFGWAYPLFHVLNGGLIFGAVFMATDPITIPKNKSGRVIIAILMGALTLVIRFRSQLYPEGVMISILVMNMFTGYIHEKTASLSKAPAKKQWLVYGIVFGLSLIAVFLLALGLPY